MNTDNPKVSGVEFTGEITASRVYSEAHTAEQRQKVMAEMTTRHSWGGFTDGPRAEDCYSMCVLCGRKATTVDEYRAIERLPCLNEPAKARIDAQPKGE